MKEMFLRANKFSQKLCSWDFPNETDNIFTNTSCPYSDARELFHRCQICPISCDICDTKYKRYELKQAKYLDTIDEYIYNKESWLDNGKPPIGCWKTGKITTLSNAFSKKEFFNEDITCWRTGKVTSMYVSAHPNLLIGTN